MTVKQEAVGMWLLAKESGMFGWSWLHVTGPASDAPTWGFALTGVTGLGSPWPWSGWQGNPSRPGDARRGAGWRKHYSWTSIPKESSYFGMRVEQETWATQDSCSYKSNPQTITWDTLKLLANVKKTKCAGCSTAYVCTLSTRTSGPLCSLYAIFLVILEVEICTPVPEKHCDWDSSQCRAIIHLLYVFDFLSIDSVSANKTHHPRLRIGIFWVLMCSFFCWPGWEWRKNTLF